MLKYFFIVLMAAVASLFVLSLRMQRALPNMPAPTRQMARQDTASSSVSVPILRRPADPPAAPPVVRDAGAIKKMIAPLSLPAVRPSMPATTTVPVAAGITAATGTTTPPETQAISPSRPALPPIREDEILSAVVKIQCPSADHKGSYIGSGFVIRSRIVVTAAHVLINTSGDPCQVIFPKNRKPAIYLWASPESIDAIKTRYEKQGIDVAFLTLPMIENYEEARVVFSDAYPVITYPICSSPELLGDLMWHYGYPGNYADHSYLAREDGQAVTMADIAEIKTMLSEDQSTVYKAPTFTYTMDQSEMHAYMVSHVPSFYGASGGLVFDASRQCIAGIGHSGTIGQAAGENYSILGILGWPDARRLIP